MNAKLEPSLRLFSLIRSLTAFGREHAFLLDVYEDSVYRGLAYLLSAFGALCMHPELIEEQQEETPYHDFGPEPNTRDEAISRLPEFLDQVGRLLNERCEIRELPLGMMHVRADTFAFLLGGGEIER